MSQKGNKMRHERIQSDQTFELKYANAVFGFTKCKQRTAHTQTQELFHHFNTLQQTNKQYNLLLNTHFISSLHKNHICFICVEKKVFAFKNFLRLFATMTRTI